MTTIPFACAAWLTLNLAECRVKASVTVHAPSAHFEMTTDCFWSIQASHERPPWVDFGRS